MKKNKLFKTKTWVYYGNIAGMSAALCTGVHIRASHAKKIEQSSRASAPNTFPSVEITGMHL